MSFNVNNLTEVRALGNNRWHWHYFTTDSLATVLGADYFSTPDGLAKCHRGDVLEIVASTAAEYQQVSIASVSGGHVVVGQPTVPAGIQAGDAVNKAQLDSRCRTLAGVDIAGNTPAAAQGFVPLQVIWNLKLSCSGGSALATLSGVRRDTGATETAATYALASGQSSYDANGGPDYSSYSWASVGGGTVTAQVL